MQKHHQATLSRDGGPCTYARPESDTACARPEKKPPPIVSPLDEAEASANATVVSPVRDLVTDVSGSRWAGSDVSQAVRQRALPATVKSGSSTDRRFGGPTMGARRQASASSWWYRPEQVKHKGMTCSSSTCMRRGRGAAASAGDGRGEFNEGLHDDRRIFPDRVSSSAKSVRAGESP